MRSRRPDRLAALLASVFVAAVSPAAAGSVDPLDALVAAYPDFLAGHEGGELLWKDGTRTPVSDGIETKTFEERLNNPDIDDLFAQPYAPGPPSGPPAEDWDPGRFVNTEFFTRMYGDCRSNEVQAHLKPVRWVDGTRLMATDVNGVAGRLQQVADELRELPREFRKYLVPSAGTYNCRNVAGSDRLSLHSLGTAIDISTAHSDYWLWDERARGTFAYRNRIPFEIVAIFEKYGFIWGGKWYHYDTMHFSYRPEQFLAAGARPEGF
ncbi:MAG: M15 family metallopeptidase [Alphaproteobacteria bacterium]